MRLYISNILPFCVFFFLIFSTSSNNLQNSTLCSVFGPPNYLYLTPPFQKAEGMESLSSVGRCFQFSFLSLSFCSSRVSALQKFRHTFPSLFICLHTPYIKYVCLQSFLKSSQRTKSKLFHPLQNLCLTLEQENRQLSLLQLPQSLSEAFFCC